MDKSVSELSFRSTLSHIEVTSSKKIHWVRLQEYRSFTLHPYALQSSMAHESLPGPAGVSNLTFHTVQLFKFLLLSVGFCTSFFDL